MLAMSNEMLLPALSLGWFLAGLLMGTRLRRNGGPAPARKTAAAVGGSRNGSIEIYVGNLPAETSDAELRTAFEAFGTVTNARVLASRFEGRAKRFAFVTMPDAKQATAAINAMSGKDYKGRRLVVNEARSPRRRGNG